MHEASLVQGLLDVAMNELEKYQATHPGPRLVISEVSCELGLISCVEEETLKACFELFAEGTVAEHAALRLSRAPLACECSDCGTAFAIKKRDFFCPCCGGTNIRFSGGHGLTLIGLAVECEENGND